MKFGNIEQKNKLFYFLKTKFQLYLFKEINPPPPLFFTLFISGHLGLTSSDTCTYTLFFIGLFFSLLYSYNHFYYYSPILNSGIGYFSIVNMVIGVVAANEKWKLYLYLFIIGDSLTLEYPEISQIYLIASSLFLCVEIYRKLVFKVVQDNKIFFIGFSTIFFFYLFNYVLTYFDIDGISRGESYFFLPFIIFVSYYFIKLRIITLKKLKVSEIKNPEMAFHFTYIMQQQLSQPSFFLFYLKEHRQTCNQSTCFCKTKTFSHLTKFHESKVPPEFVKQAIEKIYEDFINNHEWHPAQKQFIQNKFLEYELKNGNFYKVYCNIEKQIVLEGRYFRLVERFRIQEMLKEHLKRENYFDENKRFYQSIFEYNEKLVYVNKEIREIMKEKISFWTEIGKIKPSFKILQQHSHNLIKKIQNLHEFYCRQVQQNQMIIGNYDATINYAFYLLANTNEFEYSELLLTKVEKKLTQTFVKENIEIETLGMEVKVEQKGKYNILDRKQIQLVIHRISNNLAQFFKMKPKDMIGLPVLRLIPSLFRQAHIKRCNQFFNGIKPELPFQFLESATKLPFLVNKKQIKIFQMSLIFTFHIKTGFSLFCILRQNLQERNYNFLSLYEYENEYFYQEQSDIEILQSQNIKRMMKMIQGQWEEYKQIFCRKPMIGGKRYMVTTSFQQLYIHQNYTPVVSIFKDAPFTCRKSGDSKLKSYLNHKKDVESKTMEVNVETDSISSITSAHDSVINILYVLGQLNNIKIYRYFIIFFIILILICISVISVFSYTLLPEWQNNKMDYQNPLLNIEDCRKVNIVLNIVMGWEYDVNFYNNVQNNETRSLVDRLYEQQYNKKASLIFDNNFELIRDLLVRDLAQISNFVEEKIRAIRNKPKMVYYGANESLNMNIENILKNYIYDTYLLSKNQSFNNTILEGTYFQQVIEELRNGFQSVRQSFPRQIQEYQILNIIELLFLFFLLILLSIPIFKFNKFKLAQHIEVYDLLTSIDGRYVMKQIKKLLVLEEELIVTSIPPPKLIEKQEENKTSTRLRFRQYSEIYLKPQQNPIQSLFGLKSIALNEIQSNFNEIKQKLVANSLSELRKKNGELEFENSQNDPHKIVCSHWMLPLFIVGFLILLVIQFGVKMVYFSDIVEIYEQNQEFMEDLEQKSILLMNIKVYLDNYAQNNPIKFENTDLGSWIHKQLKRQSKRYSKFEIEEDVLKCMEDQNFCTFPYSQILIKEFIYNLVTDAYENKELLLEGNLDAQNQTDETRYGLFFAQQICDRSISLSFSKADNNFKAVIEAESSFMNLKLLIFVLALIYGGICIIFSCFYIHKIEKDYIRDTNLLTFLSAQMVNSNKRITSFVERLSKNNQ